MSDSEANRRSTQLAMLSLKLERTLLLPGMAEPWAVK